MAVLLGWLLGQPPLDVCRWNIADFGLGAAATVPMLAGFFLCLSWRIRPLQPIHEFVEEFVKPFFAACSWAEIGLVCLLAGVGEEMLFRGVLQGAFTRWLGVWIGVLLTNLLFGVVHLITPTYAVLAGLLGIYLSGVWILNGNLLTVMVAHALYDFIALAWVLGRQRRLP